DVGSSMVGYYAEVGYDLLRSLETQKQLVPFVRYEYLNTHNTVENNISKNLKYEKTIITTGLTFSLTQGAVAKADVQFVKPVNADKFAKTLSLGVGIMF
ncbi:MAG: hypothetical protein R6U64_06480, partial [Bacteroidales bacterium]